MTEEQLLTKKILETLPFEMDETNAVADWKWVYKRPKKPVNFCERIIEDIMDYSQ